VISIHLANWSINNSLVSMISLHDTSSIDMNVKVLHYNIFQRMVHQPFKVIG